MADLSTQSVLGIRKEVTAGTYLAPSTTTDLVRIADLRLTIGGITATVNEYTGSIHAPGPVVIGSTFEVSGRIILRGPGGAAPPAADAWVPGRILQAASFSEDIISTAVPAAPEALGVGSTTSTAVLGTSAATTLDQYKAQTVFLAGLGAGVAGMTMIRAYSAAKAALLTRLNATAYSGNYQIPRQLSYRLSATGTPTTLSLSVWHGNKRYNARGCTISSLRFNMPTASRDSQDFPTIEFTLTGELQGDADEAAPLAPTALAVPPFKAGQLWIANSRLAASSLVIDMGAEVAYEPDPNQTSGNQSAQLVRTTRTVQFTLSQVPKTTFDFLALADGQAYHGISAQWGLAAGNYFGVIATDARFNYASPDASGALVNVTGEAYVDDANRSIGLVIPWY